MIELNPKISIITLNVNGSKYTKQNTQTDRLD